MTTSADRGLLIIAAGVLSDYGEAPDVDQGVVILTTSLLGLEDSERGEIGAMLRRIKPALPMVDEDASLIRSGHGRLQQAAIRQHVAGQHSRDRRDTCPRCNPALA